MDEAVLLLHFVTWMLGLEQVTPADPKLPAASSNYLKKLVIFLTTRGRESNMRPKNVKRQASPFIENSPELEPVGGYRTDGRYFTRALLKRGGVQNKFLIEAILFNALPLTGLVDDRASKAQCR